jgi:hypothetical protein
MCAIPFQAKAFIASPFLQKLKHGKIISEDFASRASQIYS